MGSTATKEADKMQPGPPLSERGKEESAVREVRKMRLLRENMEASADIQRFAPLPEAAWEPTLLILLRGVRWNSQAKAHTEPTEHSRGEEQHGRHERPRPNKASHPART